MKVLLLSIFLAGSGPSVQAESSSLSFGDKLGLIQTGIAGFGMGDIINRITNQHEPDQATLKLGEIHSTLLQSQQITSDILVTLKKMVLKFELQQFEDLLTIIARLESEIEIFTGKGKMGERKGALQRFAKYVMNDTTTPVVLAADLSRMLKNDAKNILLIAVKQDSLFRYETLNNTKNAVLEIFKRLDTLQNIGIHIYNFTEETEISNIERMKLEAVQNMDSLINELEYSDVYWQENVVSKAIQRAVDEDLDRNETVRADYLQKELSQIYTSDHFFIIAIAKEDCRCKMNFAYSKFGQVQLATDNHTIVYRSRTAYLKNNTDIENLKIEMLKYRSKLLPLNCPGSSQHLKTEIEGEGFVALLRCKHAIRFTGSFPNGPGARIIAKYKERTTGKDDIMIMLAALM